MNHIETLKQFVEVAERGSVDHLSHLEREKLIEAGLATIKAAEKQEPVAAECKFDHEEKWVRCKIAHHNLVQSEPHNWPGYQTRLLYTTPPAAQPAYTKEDLDRAFSAGLVEGEKLTIEEAAAQRQWVGLTDDEEIRLYIDLSTAPAEEKETPLQMFLFIARVIEAKLREKNGGNQ